MSIGIWEALALLLVVLVVFGAGKLPNVMGDVAKGIKSFKREMGGADEAKDEAAPAPLPPKPEVGAGTPA